MTYIQTEWVNGKIENRGMTPEEFFNNQIWKSFEKNVNAHTLPFLNEDPRQMSREITTGKLISGKNQIALELDAAANGYKSNMYIYGADLEKLAKEGIDIRFKKNTSPVLCMTEFRNPEHINDKEIYTNEGGTKNKFQYMYNFDSLDDRSQKSAQKYLTKTQKIDTEYTQQNSNQIRENQKLDKNSEAYKRLDAAKERMKKNSVVNNIDFSQLVQAHTRHVFLEMTGNQNKRIYNPQEKESVYNFCKQLVDNIRNNDNAPKPYVMGEAYTRALDAGTSYTKTYCSKNFSLEHEKLRVEKQQQKLNQERSRGRPSWER